MVKNVTRIMVLCRIKKDRGISPFYFEGAVSQIPKEGISDCLDYKLAFPNVFQQDDASIH
jgi:hypothetical protein